MLKWTRDALSRRAPVVCFVQETFPAWIALLEEDDDYTVLTGVERGWKVHSALVYRSDLQVERIDQTEVSALWYHGSYVAAARWTRPSGSEVILASVHASPNRAEPDRDGWPRKVPLPTPRDPGLDRRWPPGLWDSDLLLLTIRDLHSELGLPVLAAGDFNEALAYDPVGGTWGREYFTRAKDYGLRSWLHERWGGEIPTRGALQLDHVLISRDVVSLLSLDADPELDPAWADPEDARRLSDHAPVWLPLVDVTG
jgi:hypothetical protein